MAIRDSLAAQSAWQAFTASAMVVLIVAAAGCSSPPPAPPASPSQSAPTPAPITVSPPTISPPSTATAPVGAPTARVAPRDPVLDDWKRAAAERIHAVNAGQLFAGRPHHLLQAVIVVEVAVDRQGQITRSKILRSPGIARLDAVALASLKSASPLPAPPSKLVGKGSLVYSETWLFDRTGKFQVRTLALPQD